MPLIDGKSYAKSLKEQIKEQVRQLKAQGLTPKLSVLMVGDDPASLVYAQQKEKNCRSCEIEFEMHRLPATASMEQVLDQLSQLNNDPKVTAIMVEMPLPKGLDNNIVQAAIAPEKDIDGANPINLGRLTSGLPCLRPCTPAASIMLAQHAGVDFKGKNVVVLGRSVTVGKPAALIALEKNATVTICHSKTQNLAEITKKADVLIVAIGRPHFVTADMVGEHAVVIDVGINSTDEGLVGDCHTQQILDKGASITPVPGGVGPVTNANLLGNIIQAAQAQLNQSHE